MPDDVVRQEDTTTISLHRFISAFLHGTDSIIHNEEHINEINVFPVSDKDTGTNLSLTLSALNKSYENVETIDAFLSEVALSVFDNARGNSGVIFSIFLDGVSKHAPKKDTLSVSELGILLNKAYLHLTCEVKDIVNGSIISFIGDCSKLIQSPYYFNLILEKQIETFLEKIHALLLETENQNPILKQNGVIDAGAYAFYCFIETFALTIGAQTLPKRKEETFKDVQTPFAHDEASDAYPSNRYCTEGKLSLKKGVGLEKIKSLIESAGDSELFLKRGDLLRFHVHCNKPVELTRSLLPYGTMLSPKIDDLHRMYQMIHYRKHDIALVTDSSADIAMNDYDTYSIHSIALSIHLGKNDLLDGLNIDREMLYSHLKAKKDFPKTSAPTLGLIKQTLSTLKKYYRQVLILTISSKMSSTYQAILNVSKDDQDVFVFDTRKISGSHGFLLHYAATLIEQKAPMPDIIKCLEKERDQTETIVAINSVKALRRSGRIPALKAFFANLTRVKPILTTNTLGEGLIIDKAFSTKESHKKLINAIIKKHADRSIKQFAVLHVNAKMEAKKLGKALSETLGFPPLYTQSVSSALGVHVGEGAIGVAFYQGTVL